MTMLAIALIMICLGSVSAVEEIDLNSTLETVNDISQDENIVINEMANEAITDDDSQEENTVGIAGENENNENLLKASDDEVLGAAGDYYTIVDVSGSTDSEFSVAYPGSATVKISSSIPWWASISSGLRLCVGPETGNDYDYASFTVADAQKGITFTPDAPGTYRIYIEVDGLGSNDYSNTITYTFYEGSPKTETETSISITPSSVAPNEEFTINYNVYEKGTTNAVNEGTISFYDQNGQIGSSINLANPTTFTYSYSNKKSYNIYAVYTPTDNYGTV